MLKWKPDYDEGSMQFESAAKFYKEGGDNLLAADSFLKYAECCKKLNELLCAATGLAEAAVLTKDKQKSMQYLVEADTLFKMSGQWERGSTLLKRLAADLIEKDEPESIEQAEKIYMKLMESVF